MAITGELQVDGSPVGAGNPVPVSVAAAAAPVVIVAQPGVTTTTDSVSPAETAVTATTAGSPQVLASFARDKDIGGYSSWTLRGRARLRYTPPPPFYVVNAGITGSAPGQADTYADYGAAETFVDPTFDTSKTSWYVTYSAQVGCNAVQNPAGFDATLKLVDGDGQTIGNIVTQSVDPSSGGATLTTLSGTYSTSVLPSFNGLLKLQLKTTSVTGVTVGTGTITFRRYWFERRRLYARVDDGSGQAWSNQYTSYTGVNGTAVTATVAEDTVAYNASPFGSVTHALEVYADDAAVDTDPDTGGSSLVIEAGSSTYLSLEAVIGSPFVFTPADLGYTRLFVQEVHLGDGAEFRWVNAEADGVDSTDAKARLSGMPDGTAIDFDGMEVTKAHLAKNGSYTPAAVLVGEV